VRGNSIHPYYSGLVSDYGNSIELVYPIGFVFELAKSVLKNSRIWFDEHDLDPYLSFSDGSFYIEKLNVQNSN